MKYAYPAVFTWEEDSGYSVEFPDIEGCVTCGRTAEEAMNMAEDALCLLLYDKEVDREIIPEASDISDLVAEKPNFTALISCDTEKYSGN